MMLTPLAALSLMIFRVIFSGIPSAMMAMVLIWGYSKHSMVES